MFSTTTLFAVLLAYPVRSAGQLLRRQDLSGVPSCGQTCLISAATDSSLLGSCSITDVSCLCKNEKLQNSVQNCVLSTCSTQDMMKMLTFATKTCPTTAPTTSSPEAPASAAAGPTGAAAIIAGLPSCGQNCLASTASNSGIVGGCSLTDVACLCKNQNFMGTVTTCVASQCSLDDKLAMSTWSSTTCPSDGASMEQPSSAAAPPAKDEAPSTNTSPSQAAETATSKPDSVNNDQTNPKSGNEDLAPSGTEQLTNTSQWSTPQDGYTYGTASTTSANAGVVQGDVNQLTNTSQSSATQNGSSYATQSSASGAMPAASQNISTPSINLNYTTNFTMPVTNSSTAPDNTSSSLSTQASCSALPQNTTSTPAQYAPDVSPASSVPLAGSIMWIATTVLIPATLLWMN